MGARFGILTAILVGCGGRAQIDASEQVPVDAAAEVDSGSTVDAGTGADSQSAMVCPAAPPSLGDACAVEGQVCAYSGAGALCPDKDDRVAWRCMPDGWLELARCVAHAACPSTPPNDGEPCEITELGLDCFYSSDGSCAASAIVQCDEVAWRHVNACGHREVPENFLLRETIRDFESTAVSHSEHSVSASSLAVAGTQLLMAYDLVSHDAGPQMPAGSVVSGHVGQSASSQQSTVYATSTDDALAVVEAEQPVAAYHAGHFFLSWEAYDADFYDDEEVLGIFVRRVSLRGEPGPIHVVDDLGRAPIGLVMQPGGGRVAYRYRLVDKEGLFAAAVVALSPDGQPVPMSKQTFVEELPWSSPVPTTAFVSLAAWGQGFVYVYPEFSTSDPWTESGLVLNFFASSELSEEPAVVRLPIGVPESASIATIRDGSVVVAYTNIAPENDAYSIRQGIVRAWSDGTWEEVPVSHSYPRRPTLVPFEDGFAMEGVIVLTGDDLSHEVALAAGKFGMAMAYGEVDRTLHLAWSSGGRVLRQRLVIRPF